MRRTFLIRRPGACAAAVTQRPQALQQRLTARLQGVYTPLLPGHDTVEFVDQQLLVCELSFDID